MPRLSKLSKSWTNKPFRTYPRVARNRVFRKILRCNSQICSKTRFLWSIFSNREGEISEPSGKYPQTRKTKWYLPLSLFKIKLITMKILHLDLKSVQDNYVEIRYFLDNPNPYESRRLCLTEIADLIKLAEQDYYVVRPVPYPETGKRLFDWLDGTERLFSRK